MSIFDKLLVKVIKSREGALHFRRWRLIETPWFALYVHCISRSDEDKDPHDHPWSFVSLILRGGYDEELWRENTKQRKEVDCYVRTPGSIAFRKAREFHKISLLEGPTWTLILRGPRVHEPWGYLTEDGWLDHETYRKRKHARQ